MDTWDAVLAEEDLKDKIHSLVNSPNFVLFFEKGESVFGAPEESRVTFARMKSEDEELPEGWKEDANFMAVNLTKLVRNEGSPQSIFGLKELKQIKILDKEQAYKKLLKQSKESGGGRPGSPHSGMIAVVVKNRRQH